MISDQQSRVLKSSLGLRLRLFALAVALAMPATLFAGESFFKSAKPVWPAGRAKEMNLLVGFRTTITGQHDRPVRLAVACSTIYRAWLNGKFLARGPARGPRGYFRVDQIDLGGHLRDGDNVLAIEVAGYNANGYQLLDQASFLQAEITAEDGRVLAATAGTGVPFDARLLTHRLQKVQRYSFQRLFTEVYRMAPRDDAWRTGDAGPYTACKLAVMPAKRLLPRGVPLPDCQRTAAVKIVARGRMVHRTKVAKLWKDRSLTNIGPKLKGFPENQLTVIPSLEIQHYQTRPESTAVKAYQPKTTMALIAGDYAILDFGVNLTGMLGAHVVCRKPTRLWFTFDEILSSGDVDFKRLSCVNLVSYDLEPGTYELESIEPYTMRYAKLICVDGQCEITDVHLRQYKHAALRAATFRASDPRLNRLFAAGIETFRQNALDIFMDCPSRERAGWLCDSFFTSRVAYDVTGRTDIERNFFQNFLLPKQFKYLPDGMLPMCYPADHNDGVFIPNWALWFVVQLDEYAQRSGDRDTVARLRGKIDALLTYFRKFENSDGLLEKLDGWVFVEWSAANKFVQDVNYPSNMLYAGALDAVADLYDRPELHAKAAAIRNVIRRQSYDGHFFVDNAVRRDGKLVVTKNRTEVCQYFAFFFKVAAPETYPELWRVLRDEFGPKRKKTKAHWDVHIANSFIGNMLRIELLSQQGRSQQILDESVAYLMYMVKRTGTLWENDGAYASCNHGFASHIVHTLYRDVLGITLVDPRLHIVRVRVGSPILQHCEGTLPTPDGIVRIGWQRVAGQRKYTTLDVPKGYRVVFEIPTAATAGSLSRQTSNAIQ